MLTENARVVAIESDGLWVETLKQSACNACSAKSGCGQHLLGKYVRDLTCIKARFLNNQHNASWKPGDEVKIAVEENALVANALLIYLLPLLCLLVLVILGHALALPEVLVALSGFGGLLTGALLIKFFYPFLLKRKLRTLDVVVLGRHRDIVSQEVVVQEMVVQEIDSREL